MDDNRYSHITNVLILIAIACVLSYDYLGTYKLVALGIGLSASLFGIILYFRRWNTLDAQDTLWASDVVEIVAIPESTCIASQYAVCGNSVEELMLQSQQLHQDVISNLLVQIEKSNWETETAKRLWMTLDYSVAPVVIENSPRFRLGLSLDGRLVSRRTPCKQTKSKVPSSQQWMFAQTAIHH